MKAQLKRLFAPKSWSLLRKEAVFIVRPLPSGHPKALSFPLVFIIRDILGYAQTSKEAKLMVRNAQVLVDNVLAKNIRQGIGIMDTLSFPLIKKVFRISLSQKGKLILVAIDEKDKEVKVCGIRGKKVAPKNKIQVQCHDGRSLLSDNTFRVGDSLVLKLPSQEIVQTLKLEKSATVLMLGGGHKGQLGVVDAINNRNVKVTCGKDSFETSPDKFLVVGKEKPVHKVVSSDE